jgi:hypothetical protein
MARADFVQNRLLTGVRFFPIAELNKVGAGGEDREEGDEVKEDPYWRDINPPEGRLKDVSQFFDQRIIKEITHEVNSPGKHYHHRYVVLPPFTLITSNVNSV